MTESRNPVKPLHPLLNPVILHRIFSSFTTPNLKNIRLVCKSWSSIASPLLQQRSQVVLIRGQKEQKRLGFKSFIPYIQSLPADSPSIFFVNYYIEHWILNEKRELNLHKFWSICGPTITSLHIGNVIFYEVETLRNALFRWTPNLEQLTLQDSLYYKITSEPVEPNTTTSRRYPEKEDFDEEYIFFDYYDHITVEQLVKVDMDLSNLKKNKGMNKLRYEQLQDENIPLEWGEVFWVYPNLKVLQIPCDLTHDMLTSILTEAGKSLGLEELSIFQRNDGQSHLDSSHFLLMSNFPKTLKTLEFYFSPIHLRSYDPVVKTLWKFTSSLRTLKMFCCNPNDYLAHPFPLSSSLFSNLKTLMISAQLLHGGPFPGNFMKHLESLYIRSTLGDEDEFSWGIDIDDWFTLSNISCGINLQKLSLRYMVNTPNFYSQILPGSNNLRILEAPLNDDQIRIIFQYLSETLEELQVYTEGRLSDKGITGGPVMIEDNTGWDPREGREFPYIGDMKKLQRFILKTGNYDLSDASIYQGFVHVKTLTYLSLSRTKISRSALEDLVKVKPNIILRTPGFNRGGDL